MRRGQAPCRARCPTVDAEFYPFPSSVVFTARLRCAHRCRGRYAVFSFTRITRFKNYCNFIFFFFVIVSTCDGNGSREYVKKKKNRRFAQFSKTELTEKSHTVNNTVN